MQGLLPQGWWPDANKLPSFLRADAAEDQDVVGAGKQGAGVGEVVMMSNVVVARTTSEVASSHSSGNHHHHGQAQGSFLLVQRSV